MTAHADSFAHMHGDNPEARPLLEKCRTRALTSRGGADAIVTFAFTGLVRSPLVMASSGCMVVVVTNVE